MKTFSKHAEILEAQLFSETAILFYEIKRNLQGEISCVRFSSSKMLSSLDSSLRWKRVFLCSTWMPIIFSKQTMSAHTKRTAGNFYREYFVLLDVVIDSTTVNVDHPGRAGHSHHFDIFATTRAPDFVSENDGRWLFSHGYDWLQSDNAGAFSWPNDAKHSELSFRSVLIFNFAFPGAIAPSALCTRSWEYSTAY
jgi:hypothetical protein